jgi:hypothetical protein
VLDRFGENNIRPGAPMATLEEALVPAFLMHRLQQSGLCRFHSAYSSQSPFS